MAEIFQLKSEVTEQRESAIVVLNDALESVKSGQAYAVAVAIVKPNGEMQSVWSDAPAGLLVGAVSLLQHRLISSLED